VNKFQLHLFLFDVREKRALFSISPWWPHMLFQGNLDLPNQQDSHEITWRALTRLVETLSYESTQYIILYEQYTPRSVLVPF